MLIGRQPRTTSFSLKFIMMFVLAGCFVSSLAMGQEVKDNLSNKVANSQKNSKLVASTNFKSKTEINKGNLESLSSSLAGYISSVTETSTSSVNSDEVMYKVIEYLNTPYLWGGTSKRGIDCSAFVQSVMYQALGVALPRTSLEQSGVGEDVEVKDLKFGDLLFFDTMRKGRVTHVGMYLSDGYFVHSGSSTGVIVTSLEKDTYSRSFLKAKRVIEQ